MFKIGDKVKCIDSEDRYLKIGQIYTVKGIKEDLLALHELSAEYFVRRFILASKYSPRNLSKTFKIEYVVIYEKKEQLVDLFKLIRELKKIKEKNAQKSVKQIIQDARNTIYCLQATKKYYIHRKTGLRGETINECILRLKRYRKDIKREIKIESSRILAFKINKFREIKKPKNNIPCFGVEIEGALKLDYEKIMSKMIEEIPDSYRYCQLATDGSLNRLDGTPFELRVLLPMNDYKDKMKAIYGFLNKYGFNVNSTCGLHVHLDCSHILQSEIDALYNRLVKAQNFLFKISHRTRKTNGYCRQSSLNSNKGDRYRAINWTALGRHQTLEIRLKNATTDINEVISYLMLLKRIYDTKISFTETERLTDKKLEKQFDLSPDLWNNLTSLKQKYAA
jgi:hypothetical protein